MPSRPLTPQEQTEELARRGHPASAPAHLTPHLTAGALRLDPTGSANPSIASARNAVRHRIRDGVPSLDTAPVPFNMVRLEDLTDQIPATPTPVQTIFQCRFEDVPTKRYLNAQVVPNTLVAYVDGSWAPTSPSQDVDVNGNFSLPVPPFLSLKITYAWQYMSDGELDQFIDEARQWLREFNSVSTIPDGLVPALVSYASHRALVALSRSATLASARAGDTATDWADLIKGYAAQASAERSVALQERRDYYTQGPEALDPTAVDISHPMIDPYTPLR